MVIKLLLCVGYIIYGCRSSYVAKDTRRSSSGKISSEKGQLHRFSALMQILRDLSSAS